MYVGGEKSSLIRKESMARENNSDIGDRILRSRVGDYTAMKPLNSKLKFEMQKIALYDSFAEGASCPLLDKNIIDKEIKRKNKHYITAAYLYCNWRVWATHERDERLAREYQKVCDLIDATVFDEWKGKEEIKYFIRETD